MMNENNQANKTLSKRTHAVSSCNNSLSFSKITVTENSFVMTSFTSAKDSVELNKNRSLHLKLVRCSSHIRVKKTGKNRRHLINTDKKHIFLTAKHAYS